jgi:hypothetical protein
MRHHPLLPDVSLERNLLNSFATFVENISVVCCKGDFPPGNFNFYMVKKLLDLFVIIVENISIICFEVILDGDTSLLKLLLFCIISGIYC